LAGGQVRGASKKLGPPYLFLQPLKLATSNLVYNLIGLGEELAKKQLLGPQLAKIRARGAFKKIGDPRIYFCSH